MSVISLDLLVLNRDLIDSKYVAGNKDACWPWMGSMFKNGYGRLHIDGMVMTAHRAVLILATGENLPRHIEACHKCDNPRCVNPEHLFAGTRKENAMDKKQKNRCHKPSGQLNASCKLTDDDVYKIRGSELGNQELGEMFGVSHTNISMIRNRHAWKHI